MAKPEKRTLTEVSGELRNMNPKRTPLHEKLPACPTCKAPPRESCVDRQGRKLPHTATHAARVAVKTK